MFSSRGWCCCCCWGKGLAGAQVCSGRPETRKIAFSLSKRHDNIKHNTVRQGCACGALTVYRISADAAVGRGELSRCTFLVYSLMNINESWLAISPLSYKSTKFNTRPLGAVRLHICLAMATNCGDLERPDCRMAR